MSWSPLRSVTLSPTVHGRSEAACGTGNAHQGSPMSHFLAICFLAVLAVTAACSSAADESLTRVPVNHRSASSACPQGRGAGVSSIPANCLQSSTRVACTRDSDCGSGANGRCLQDLGPACGYSCSYDDCTDDADCSEKAPCACRSSTSATAANTCATDSNCRVDADCGHGGFCSPSLLDNVCQCFSERFCQADAGSSCSETGSDGVTKSVPCSCGGNCGHGYFCHTAKDTCLDDSDCARGTCNFDLTSRAWMCTAFICPS